MKHCVKIPSTLKSYKDGIGAGLMYLALGRFDVKTRESDSCELVTVQFYLSEQAEAYLKELIPTYSKREIFKAALAWVSRQPKHLLQTNI